MSSFNDAFLDGCSVDVSDDYTGPASRALTDYWLSLAAAAPTGPRWTDVDLMAIPNVAPLTIVKDVVAEKDNRVNYVNRYWGTGITASFGIDATGKEIAEYYSPRFVGQLRLLYDFLFTGRKLVRLSGRAKMFENHDSLLFESVQIPIYTAAGKPAHILMAYDFSL